VSLIRTILIVCLICDVTLVSATDDLLDAGRAASIDYVLQSAVVRGLISGGTVLVGNREGAVYLTSYGKTGSALDSTQLNERTIFDVASLTKVIATAPAVMKLLEEGQITLLDPLTRWFPELEGTGREDITILNLLTHTSGLNDIELAAGDNIETILRKAAIQKSGRLPGGRFLYADINFILLGDLVQRVSGKSVDQYCREHVYGPLRMNDTMFQPPPERNNRIAPTIGLHHELLTGLVQDENAQKLGGIAGHAGLFSSAADLARFAAMILNNGAQGGTRIFSEKVLAQMTSPYFYSQGQVVRGLGWDIYSPYSSPKGSFFSDMSFGHTGYSGSSIWIDPRHDLFVILLTVRLDYRDKRHFNRLRSDISTIAASIFSQPQDIASLLEN
jgi:CubicO group peptidase (beta-lactamase class C family)